MSGLGRRILKPSRHGISRPAGSQFILVTRGEEAWLERRPFGPGDDAARRGFFIAIKRGLEVSLGDIREGLPARRLGLRYAEILQRGRTVRPRGCGGFGRLSGTVCHRRLHIRLLSFLVPVGRACSFHDIGTPCMSTRDDPLFRK